MKIADKNMIIHTVQNHNILPITSSCNISCIFCSHKSNPQGVNVYRLPKLSLDDIKEMISFLNKNKKIIIGESATRIIEGEPFVRDDILEILRIIREEFKKEEILITTNGIGLNEQKIIELKKLNPVEINVSLNSFSEYGRNNLLGDTKPISAIEGIKLLDKYKIDFHGSIVAMPMITGYKDIYDTISFLDAHKSKTIRVFVPGFTKSSTIKFNFDTLRIELNKFISKIKKRFKAPIILEPSVISNLIPVVEGVIYNSQAHKLGIMSGDIIYNVNNKKFSTRVDCFNYIFKSENPVLKINRNKKELEIKLSKDKNTPCGIVMLYDISMDVKKEVYRIINRHKAYKVLILVSELGKSVMNLLFKEEIQLEKIDIRVVKNNFFGGSIKSGGLLVVEDIIRKISEVKKEYIPDVIIISSKSLDHKGRDLAGKSIYQIEEETSIQVEII